MGFSRRHFLGAGASAVALEALATGLPTWVFTRPRTAWPNEPSEASPRYLVLSAAQAGDPVNANTPGSYVEGPVHANSELLAPRPVRLGTVEAQAALPWSTLPQDLLDQSCFFHHATYTNAHGNHAKVMRLMGATDRDEMLASVFSKALHEPLATVQAEPLNVGAPGLTFEGRRLGEISPRSLKSALVRSDDRLARLQSLRDESLDRLHAELKTDGTRDQRRLLDRFAKSRREARSISDALLDRLDAISGDAQRDQVLAASVLLAMNVSGVVALQLRFGRDNHTDADLAREISETQTGVASIGDLFTELEGLGLRDRVVFASLNVFGRTLAKKGTRGRDHNPHHHVLVMMGSGVRGSVVGDIRPKGNDYTSTAIDSRSGRGMDDGDIPYEESLAAAAKTLGRALGIPRSLLDGQIRGGKPVEAALRDPV